MKQSHPSLLILGYSEAAMLLRQPEGRGIRAIISIHGQREYPVDTHEIPHSLVLQFDDTEIPNETDPLQAARIRIRQRQMAEIGLRLTPPTAQHASFIIDFARSIEGMEGVLLCQCHAGMSRSPAAALLCLATWSGLGNEAQCVEKVLAGRTGAIPHRDLVAFGDQLLNRNGKLLAALDQACPY